MALVFGALTTDKVDCGSAASLDDIPSAAFTVYAWVYRTANGANQHIFSKDNSFPSGWSLTANNVSGTDGELRFVVFRNTSTATDWADAISVSGTIPLNTWTFVAGRYDPATTPQMKLYAGGLTTPVAEVASYFRQQDGTGSFLSDAAANLYVGNLQRSTTLPFLGRIQRGGLIPGALALGDLQILQYGTLVQAAAFAPKLLFDFQATGTQLDFSGNGNTGTITGATTGSGPELWVAAPPLAVPAIASGNATATAGLAASNATAYPATATGGATATAGLAASNAAAYAATATGGASASAGAATANATAYAATATGAANATAGLAAAASTAYPPVGSGGGSATAGLATANATAYAATAGVFTTATAGLAASNAVAYAATATGNATATAGLAATAAVAYAAAASAAAPVALVYARASGAIGGAAAAAGGGGGGAGRADPTGARG
jgi:hypothetical protein